MPDDVLAADLEEGAPCPVCGMALEQVLAPGTMPSADAGDDPEYRDMRRRFIVSLVFTLPLLVVAMGGMFVGKHLPWLELLLAAPVCLWGGYPFSQRAWRSLQTGNLNMFTLIGLGVFVAVGYSLVATIAPGIFPASFRDASGGVAVYYEAAATIVTLVLFGQVIELRARARTGDAIRALLVALLAQAGGPDGDFASGLARDFVLVPNVEHITILFSDTSHRAALQWLNEALGWSGTTAYRDRRMIWYLVQLVGALLLPGFAVTGRTGALVLLALVIAVAVHDGH